MAVNRKNRVIFELNTDARTSAHVSCVPLTLLIYTKKEGMEFPSCASSLTGLVLIVSALTLVVDSKLDVFRFFVFYCEWFRVLSVRILMDKNVIVFGW